MTMRRKDIVTTFEPHTNQSNSAAQNFMCAFNHINFGCVIIDAAVTK